MTKWQEYQNSVAAGFQRRDRSAIAGHASSPSNRCSRSLPQRRHCDIMDCRVQMLEIPYPKGTGDDVGANRPRRRRRPRISSFGERFPSWAITACRHSNARQALPNWLNLQKSTSRSCSCVPSSKSDPSRRSGPALNWSIRKAVLRRSRPLTWERWRRCSELALTLGLPSTPLSRRARTHDFRWISCSRHFPGRAGTEGTAARFKTFEVPSFLPRLDDFSRARTRLRRSLYVLIRHDRPSRELAHADT